MCIKKMELNILFRFNQLNCLTFSRFQKLNLIILIIEHIKIKAVRKIYPELCNKVVNL